jgi:GMP synthase-like glutamine amidotransferase
VLIIQNDPMETLGAYEQYFIDHQVNHHVFYVYEATTITQFPVVEDFDVFIVGSTPISANHVKQHPFLRCEWQYLASLIEHEAPCLGICCGAQLLMKLVGADVVPAPEKEIGSYIVHLTKDGLSDSLFAGFPLSFPVFQWHNAQFTVPPKGKHLITGNPCLIQAASWKQIQGILFHLEVNHKDVQHWINIYSGDLEAVGKTRSQILSECRKNEKEMTRLAHQLMANLLQLAY